MGHLLPSGPSPALAPLGCLPSGDLKDGTPDGEGTMRSFKFLAGLVPVFAIAACGSDGPTPTAVPPAQVVELSRGAQLARDLCGECHGPDLLGATRGDVSCPALRFARGYSLAEFNTLLTEGIEPDGGTVNELMSVTRTLTPADRQALHEYLTKYAEQ